LPQDEDVWVGIFPERKEVLVSHLGFARFPRQSEGPTQFPVRECADGLATDNAGVIEDFLELSRRRCGALLRRQMRLASQVNGIRTKVKVTKM